MKYLLRYLEGVSDAPDISDPAFQQLLHDVNAGKPQTKSADAFYDSLDKIVNELRSTAESFAFQKPVNKRDAPDYYDVIVHPMDLSTIQKNIRAHKYKNKVDFAKDLNLIWDNCFLYNTQENHPLRANARFLKQKADYHLEFLADRNEKAADLIFPTFSSHSTRASPAPRTLGSFSSHVPVRPSGLRESSTLVDNDEDAAGESDENGPNGHTGDDHANERFRSFRSERTFRDEARQGSPRDTEGSGIVITSPTPHVTPEAEHRRSSVASASQAEAGPSRINGFTSPIDPLERNHVEPFRPKLQANLDDSPALLRTPFTMTHFYPVSLSTYNPDKGKAREILQSTTPPPWYPATDLDETKPDATLWRYLGRDESLVAGLPALPTMAPPEAPPRRRIRPRPPGPPKGVAHTRINGAQRSEKLNTPPLEPSAPRSIKRIIDKSVDKLNESRRIIGKIHEWQRLEAEGHALIPPKLDDPEEKALRREESSRLKEYAREESNIARERRKLGGEVGEAEAALQLRTATASMLALSGFDGANEMALNTFTRVTEDVLQGLGQTLRLFLDGFSQTMGPEEMILHTLHENGRTRTMDLETHLKDEVEKEQVKLSELARKVRQAYDEVTVGRAIGDDAMFADDGEMLLDGNFADELGEDFLGLRELGLDRELGLKSLTVPTSLLHGRRRKLAEFATNGPREAEFDYPPPPPFVPLTPQSLHSQLPALLHAFFDGRMSSGAGLEDDSFDGPQSQIGSLGQIIVKAPGVKRKREPADHTMRTPKKGRQKALAAGIGKGNWIRPSKEERARRTVERAEKLSGGSGSERNGHPALTPGSEDAIGEEDDAEGEEE